MSMSKTTAIQWLEWMMPDEPLESSDLQWAERQMYCREALSMAIEQLKDSGWHNCKDKTRPVVGHDYLCAVISPTVNGNAAMQQQVFHFGNLGWSNCNGVIVFAWRELPKLPEEVVFPW